MKIFQKVEVLVVDGSLLVLGDIIEVDDLLGWGLKVDVFPLGVVGEVVIFHLYNYKSNLFKLYF